MDGSHQNLVPKLLQVLGMRERMRGNIITILVQEGV